MLFRSIQQFRTVKSSGRRLTGVVLDTSTNVFDKLRALNPEEMEIRELTLKEMFVSFMR